MKTLYLDCGMGAAGDMLTAALLELLPDPDGFVDELNALGIPGVQYRREASVKCGITGTHMSVTVIGVEESDHAQDPAHNIRPAAARGGAAQREGRLRTYRRGGEPRPQCPRGGDPLP